MKFLNTQLLFLMFMISASATAMSHQQSTQYAEVNQTYTISRTINFGDAHNRNRLISKFQNEAPEHYEEAWDFVSRRLSLPKGTQYDDLVYSEHREATLLLVPIALDYFHTVGFGE